VDHAGPEIADRVLRCRKPAGAAVDLHKGVLGDLLGLVVGPQQESSEAYHPDPLSGVQGLEEFVGVRHRTSLASGDSVAPERYLMGDRAHVRSTPRSGSRLSGSTDFVRTSEQSRAAGVVCDSVRKPQMGANRRAPPTERTRLLTAPTQDPVDLVQLLTPEGVRVDHPDFSFKIGRASCRERVDV